MKNIVGIDLGTTFSALALLDDSGKPSVIKADAERILASCVWAKDPLTLQVGALARNSLATEPKSVAARFKRHMGSDHTIHLEKLGRPFTPEEASAQVLRKLIQEASKVHGPIDEVVITVPANFAERQRRATIKAGEMAGVKVQNIINEPTAAALAYATQHTVSGTVLIYDMGGGTFDVTIAKIQGTNVECLTSEGDMDLGGIDFDSRLAGIVDDLYAQTHGKSLKEDLGLQSPDDERNSPVWQELLLEAEKWKIQLSSLESIRIKFSEGPSGRVQGEIRRADFESAIASFVAKAEMLVETALDNAKLEAKDIDHILLVGGSTRIPAIRNSIRKMLGKEPSEAVNADEAVALGAATYAGLRTDKSNLKPLQRQRLEKVAVKDVANHHYGTLAVNHDGELGRNELRVDILIPKDTPLPCSKTERYHTMVDGQKFINCRVTQSSHAETNPDLVNIRYEAKLGPLPQGRAAGRPVEVTFSYDEDQTIQMQFLDVESGMKVQDVLQLKADTSPQISMPEFRIE